MLKTLLYKVNDDKIVVSQYILTREIREGRVTKTEPLGELKTSVLKPGVYTMKEAETALIDYEKETRKIDKMVKLRDLETEKIKKIIESS